jgi:hypothetical protein
MLNSFYCARTLTHLQLANMEPDVKQEQQQAGEDEQQQQEQVAGPAEVKQEEVKTEEEVAEKETSASREVSDDELREKLLQMLQESDLSTVTGGEAVASFVVA